MNASGLTRALFDADGIIFDNDGVLYRVTPPILEAYLMAGVEALRRVAGLDTGQAMKMMRNLPNPGNASIISLIIRNGADPKTAYELFTRFVDDDAITPSQTTPGLFAQLGIPCSLLTQGSRSWVVRTLIGGLLKGSFADDSIYDFERCGGVSKAASVEPFLRVLGDKGWRAERTILVDDTLANHAHARKLGMVTVLVTGDKHYTKEELAQIDFHVRHVDDLLAVAGQVRPNTAARNAPRVELG